MKKILVKYFIIFLIIGLIGFLFTNCGSSLNYIVSLSNAPIYLNFKVIYPSQVAFNIGTVLPLKIEYESKSYNIYPLILEISLYSTYQYIIDHYTSFILKIDNQIFFPKLPEEIISVGPPSPAIINFPIVRFSLLQETDISSLSLTG